VIETVLEVRRALEEEGFQTWPKVTGGKGLHIMAPLGEAISHDEAHRYSRALAERIAATNRGRYAVSASMAQRPGRPITAICTMVAALRRPVPGRPACGRAFPSPRP